jgi:hypothetical protein
MKESEIVSQIIIDHCKDTFGLEPDQKDYDLAFCCQECFKSWSVQLSKKICRALKSRNRDGKHSK